MVICAIILKWVIVLNQDNCISAIINFVGYFNYKFSIQISHQQLKEKIKKYIFLIPLPQLIYSNNTSLKLSIIKSFLQFAFNFIIFQYFLSNDHQLVIFVYRILIAIIQIIIIAALVPLQYAHYNSTHLTSICSFNICNSPMKSDPHNITEPLSKP